MKVLREISSKNTTVKFIVAILFLSSCHVTLAGTLSGIVKDNNDQILEGVMIRLSDPVSGMSESVFSNSTGEFTLTTGLQEN